MPRLPKGMVRKRKAFYLRTYKNGGESWTPLGSDYDVACARLKTLREQAFVPTRGTVSQLADRWLAAYIATARNEKGVRVAQQRVRNYLKPFLGLKPVTRVTSDDLREYRLWVEGKGLAVQTVSHILADARCFFRWGEDTGYLARSPFPRRLLPRIQERPPDRLGREAAELVGSLEEPFGFICRLGLGTGLRWGEMSRARAADLQNGVLTVSMTKSGRMRRVPVSEALGRDIRGRVGLLIGSRDASVFARAVRRRTGLASFHPHQLRHEFACQWLEAGGNLAALQQVLGHASITTTQRYARLTDEAVQREAERVYREQTGNAKS